MLFFVTIGAYLFFLVFVCLFLEGAAALRESPKPQLADVEIGPLQPMQFDAPSMMVFEPECLGEWGEELGLSMAPLAQPNLRGSGWQSNAELNRL